MPLKQTNKQPNGKLLQQRDWVEERGRTCNVTSSPPTPTEIYERYHRPVSEPVKVHRPYSTLDVFERANPRIRFIARCVDCKRNFYDTRKGRYILKEFVCYDCYPKSKEYNYAKKG